MFTPNLLTANDKAGTYPASYYAATANKTAPFETIEGDQSCDIVVIGGGFTGLSSALHLAERGFDVILLEAHRVGWGASGRNGGQVGSGQRREQDDLEKMVGRDDAKKLWDASRQAIEAKLEKAGVLLISEDLEEILELSDWVAPIYEGKFMDIIPCDEVKRENVGAMMAGLNLEER